MALAAAGHLSVQVHLYKEALVVVGALLAGQAVLQNLAALPLDQFLKGGLIVPGAGQSLHLPAEDILLYDLPGRSDPAVQINRGQHCLHSVRLDGGALSAAAGLLALAQVQILAQMQRLRHLYQAVLTHQGRPGPGQFPLRQIRVIAVQVVGHHHAQDRVTQELQPLVALEASPALIGTGTVGQRIFQQRRIPKFIAQLFFQRGHQNHSSFFGSTGKQNSAGWRSFAMYVV